MLPTDFNYTYPFSLIAQYPLEKREASRMMVLDREMECVAHQKFSDLPNYFSDGDILVLNNSKVFPCRLFTSKKSGGRVECFLIREVEPFVWECFLRASKKVKKGTKFNFSEELSGEVVADTETIQRLKLYYKGSLDIILKAIGHVPLPPYIKRQDQPQIDEERYQTIYASNTGSVAAPTAGFHFTENILSEIKEKRVRICFVTLHVGLGTFIPIRTEKIEDHQMHGEFYEIPDETASLINRAKKEGRRITVVGTTAVRAMESACDDDGFVKPGSGYTEKFIYPPYKFMITDRLLTNFHQPQSTLLVLVSAFAGREFILKAYEQAIENRYRLFSYGDCMFIT